MSRTTARRDARHRTQPSLLDRQPPPASTPDEGIRSRNDNLAAQRPRMPKSRQLWLSRIILAGPRGTTLHELSQRYSVAPNTFSGRVTELVNAGLVVRTQLRRPTDNGSANVFVAAEYYSAGPSDDATSPPAASTGHRPPADARSSRAAAGDYLPDQLTAPSQPRTTGGDLVTAGRCYALYDSAGGLMAGRVNVREDDAGDLHVYRIDPAKSQRVDMLPDGTRWEALS